MLSGLYRSLPYGAGWACLHSGWRLVFMSTLLPSQPFAVTIAIVVSEVVVRIIVAVVDSLFGRRSSHHRHIHAIHIFSNSIAPRIPPGQK